MGVETPKKYICIHGHFYQPPRENPWLEAIEVEDSASPHHDWNERVNAECYASNAVARVLDDNGLIEEVVNTYEHLSFDFGPTLLSWLEDADPQTYEAVVEADRRSVKARGGHGNGMAQAYNHVILPLASPRDKDTQVRWGVADFRHRFGRDPEGMWLPETAVDEASLEVLAEAGLRYAVLAPHQAAAIRPLEGDRTWTDVEAHTLDTTRPYLCRLPSGRSISIFFYDGALSRAVAFEGLLGDGDAFARRLLDRFSGLDDTPALVHIATDGESYGHHHKYGEMALAHVIRRLLQDRDVELINYGAFLDLVEPTNEVRVVERSSWSCAHGVGRWSADCGCTIGGGSQAWRAPLRDSLDWLRDELDIVFERAAEPLLRNPWDARGAYLSLVLDRSATTIDEFLDEHATRRLDHFDRADALSLLEMQRHRMLMYTSCGWFFDDCAGIEATQILKYAARAIQLASGFGARNLEQRFVERLSEMASNDPDAGDGAKIYEERVRPSIVDLRRVVSHHAITRLFETAPVDKRSVYCYVLRDLDWRADGHGGTQLAVGRVRVQSTITRAIDDVSYGLLHLGGHDFNCSLRGAVTAEGHNNMRDDVFDTYRHGSLTEVIHQFDEHFEGRYFGLQDLFVEGRRTVLATISEGVLDEMERTFDEFFEEHRRLFDMLRASSFPLPHAFARTVEFALERRIITALEHVAAAPKTPEAALDKLEQLAREVEYRRAAVSESTLAPPLTNAVEALADHLVPNWRPRYIVSLRRALAVAESLAVEPDRWAVQNTIVSSVSQRPPKSRAKRREVGALLEELGISKVVLDSDLKSPRSDA